MIAKEAAKKLIGAIFMIAQGEHKKLFQNSFWWSFEYSWL
jgi:hypothetical protein